MDARIVIDGKAMKLASREVKVVLDALQDYRVQRYGSRSRAATRERDLLIAEMHDLGHSDAQIGRIVGRSAKAVRAAIGRVQDGRWG